MDLNFQFQSLSDFWFMSGHGPYVWVCYLVTYIGLGYLVLGPITAKKRFFKQARRQQKLAQSEPSNTPVSNPPVKES